MRSIGKWFFLLLFGLAILGSIALISQLTEIPWLSGQVNQLLEQVPWIRWGFEGILIFMAVVLFVLLLLVLGHRTGKRTIWLEKEAGDIGLPKKAVESIIRQVIRDQHLPDPEKIRLKVLRNDHLSLEVIVQTDENRPLELLGETLQVKIEQALEQAAQLTIDTIDVVVHREENVKRDFLGNPKRQLL